jgi:hypothetical protein
MRVKKSYAFCVILFFFLVSVSGMKLEAQLISSKVYTLIMAEKCPLEFNITYSDDWKKPKNLTSAGEYEGAELKDESWTFPLMLASKITAFKEEMNFYTSPDPGRTAEDLSMAQQVLAGYGITIGGNFDEHWKTSADEEENNRYEVEKSKLIESLKDTILQNSLWAFMMPALSYQLKTMSLRNQGVVVTSFEYVRDYFGPSYNLEAARKWYLQDEQTSGFAYQDYAGKIHPARKITAFIERAMFKHQICSLSRVRSVITKTETWLNKILKKKYNESKAYWS